MAHQAELWVGAGAQPATACGLCRVQCVERRTSPDPLACCPPPLPPAARCLDQYFALRVREVEGNETGVAIDPRLTDVVERMMGRCCEHGQWEQAVGVAMEGRRLDKLEEVVQASPDQAATLTYALRVCQATVVNKAFRQQVLRLLVRLYEACPAPDWVEIAQCLMFLDDAKEVAAILGRLTSGSEVGWGLGEGRGWAGAREAAPPWAVCVPCLFLLVWSGHATACEDLRLHNHMCSCTPRY